MVENQKTLLEIDIDIDSLNSQAAEGKQKVQDLSDQLKVLQLMGKSNSAEFVALSGQMKAYQQTVNQATQVNKQLTLAQNVASGSIDEMRANLSIITRQYNSLSAAERDNDAIGGKLLTTQKTLSDSLKTLEGAGGNTTRQIGSYKDAIDQSLAGMLPFSTELSNAAKLFNSLSVASAESAAATEAAAVANAEATATAEALALANEQLATAESANAAAQEAINVLTQQNTVTMAELTAAQTAAAEAALALTATQEAQAAAATEAAAAQTGAAAATEAAAGGFKLFDLVLKSSIIGAIVGIVLLLINYLKTFDPLIDLVEQAFAGLNAAVQFVVAALKNAFLAFQNIGQVMSNIGDFFAHPIDSIKNFGSAMAQAAKDAANLKEAEQDLADAMKVSEVATADAAQKTAALILAARNRSLSVADRKKLLDDAAKVNQDDFDRRKKLNDQEIALAVENARIKGQLTKDQLDLVKKLGVAELVALQNDSTIKGKITDEDIDKFKKAQLDQINIRQETTQRAEKIQNRIDSDAEKAAAAEEKRQAKLQVLREKNKKAADELEISRQKTLAYSQSQREQETSKIEVDFNKRILAAKGYSDLQKQLEIEKQAALKKLRDDFAIKDAKDANDFDNLKNKGQQDALKHHYEDIKKIDNEFYTGQQSDLITNLQAQHDLVAAENERNKEFDLSQKDLTATQVEEINEKYRQQTLDNDTNFETQRTDINKQFSDQRIAQAETERAAAETFEKAKREAASDTLGVIQTIFGKNSAIGKAALIVQRALAIAEVVISTQKQVAAIELAAAYQSAQAALVIPFPFSLAAIAGIQAAAGAKVVLAEVVGAIQVATIVAQTISGFARGGLFYSSDGRGGVLPGYSKHDNINARLREGEGIVVSEAMQNPAARSVVSAINVAHGGRSFDSTHMGSAFATGGVYGLNFATTDNSIQQRQLEEIAVRVANSIPRQILVVEDVNAAQADKAYVASRENI